MIIAAATGTGGLDDQVSSVFGRCQTYTFVEVEENTIKSATVEPNAAAAASGGAGIQAAQLIVNRGAKAVLAGDFGPNASGVLASAGVEMVSVRGMTVREAVEKYLSGELKGTAGAGGFGAPVTPASGGYPPPVGGPVPPPAGVYGGGYGRGMGMGRGGGRGMGMGRGGRGGGMGRGGFGGMDQCTCPNCGYSAPHVRGQPCYTQRCPRCGAPMVGARTW